MNKRIFYPVLALLVLFLTSSLTYAQKTQVITPSGFNTVSAGEFHTLAVKEDGSLWAWGRNDWGQLGDGTTTDRFEPVKIMDDVASVSAGYMFSLAVKTDESLWTFGNNEYGKLGDGTATDRHAPVKIMDGVASVDTGSEHSIALKTDGTLWAWGWNSAGQLGDGTKDHRYAPVKIMDGVTCASIGDLHGFAVKTDGSLWVWGNNLIGQLGDGTKIERLIPIEIMDGIVSVSVGSDYSFIIKADRSLWAFGNNTLGTLGDGTTTLRTAPVKIMDDVAFACAGQMHSLAIKSDGSLWAWGLNKYTQLGDGTNEDSVKPIKVLDDAVSAASTSASSFAVTADGNLWAWGYGYNGYRGDGTTESSAVPVKIMGGLKLPDWTPILGPGVPPAPGLIRVVLDGRELSFDQPPIIENGRMLVPLRFVAEALGAAVDWSAPAQAVTAIKGETMIILQIGNNTMIKNGVDVTLDVPPRILNSRTLVPVRAVSEAFGAYVDWDGANRTVIINSGGYSSTAAVSKILAGETRNLRFGGYNWRVLDVQDGKALIITEDIIERRPYNADFTAVTWETCDLRKYLNGDFLKKFTPEEQALIVETKIDDPDNLWYGAPGGNSTWDKVFLLSIGEADRYFGNSGDYENMKRKDYFFGDLYGISAHIVDSEEGNYISNEHDSDRAANYYDSNIYVGHWWLRSTGGINSYGSVIDGVSYWDELVNVLAATVDDPGYINVLGFAVNSEIAGVRPAVWLNLTQVKVVGTKWSKPASGISPMGFSTPLGIDAGCRYFIYSRISCPGTL